MLGGTGVEVDYPQLARRHGEFSTLPCFGREQFPTLAVPMRVELRYTDGDPHAMAARQNLVEVLTEDAFETPIQMVVVGSMADADLLGFTGSPSILIDSADIYPAAGDEPSLEPRLYPPDDDLDGSPTEPIPGKRLIRRAVERARGWSHGLRE